MQVFVPLFVFARDLDKVDFADKDFQLFDY